MTRHASGQRARRRSGFTLVELMVAIVVLLVGVVAALRIFPRGFEIFTRTQQTYTGLEMTDRLVRELTEHPENLPDGIYPVDNDATPAADMATFAWDDMTAINYLDYAGGPQAYKNYIQGADAPWPLWEPYSVRVLRRVVGERCVIPSVVDADNKVYFAPRYLVRFGPMETSGAVSIYDLRYRKVSLEELNGLLKRMDSLPDKLYYAIDYWNGKAYFLPDAQERKVRLVCYQQVVGVLTRQEPAGGITVSAATDLTTLPVPTVIPGMTAGSMVPGSEQLNRAYSAAASSTGLQSGQYFIDDNGGSAGLLYGTIDFAQADAGRTVKIDYTVADWNILHEDVTVNPDGYLQLSLPPKMRNRAASQREPTTWGLSGPMANDSVVLVLVNRRTGVIAEVKVDNPNQPSSYPISGDASLAGYLIKRNTKNYSWLHLETSDNHDAGRALQGETYRVYYRAVNDWTLQLYRPPVVFNYTVESAADLNLVADTASSDTLTTGWSGVCQTPLNPWWLGFPAAYAGHTVLVDYYYYPEYGVTTGDVTIPSGQNVAVPVNSTTALTARKQELTVGTDFDLVVQAPVLNFPSGSAQPAQYRVQIISIDDAAKTVSVKVLKELRGAAETDVTGAVTLKKGTLLLHEATTPALTPVLPLPASAPLLHITGEAHTIPPRVPGKGVSLVRLQHVPAAKTRVTVRGASVTVRALWIQQQNGPARRIDFQGEKPGTINERWQTHQATVILPANPE
ncbi:MAG TPA: prepilin-type N-terminal cleavage/methylation domain-containing protein [Armatimonadota bacterium]|jgi:prepilin-type N-terminal cleavage/methylation domain-containing protein